MAIETVRQHSALAVSANDSRGTDFWLMFTGNFGASSTLSLFLAGDVATTGTVTIPGLGFSAPFTITPGAVTTVTLPNAAQLQTSDVVENKGIHVTAAGEVAAYGLNQFTATTDAFLGLPTDIAGTDYVVLGFPNVNIVNATQLGFVATEDATVVTVTPAVTTGARPAGVPYTVQLDQGEAYQLRNTNAAPADLSGTIVTSSKPIALYGGHACANIPNGGTFACDYIVEQLPPTTTWGRNFVTVPLATRLNGDTFRFLAATDGTTVAVNGATVATLDRGQVHQRIIAAASTVTSNEPILVAQYSNGSTFDNVTSDPFMMIVPPDEQFLAAYTVSTPATGFSGNFINVAAPSAADGAITLDGTAIPAASFTPIGASGFHSAQLQVALGSHNLTGPLPFGVWVYGFGNFDSYGYPGGMSLSPVAVVTSISLAPKTGTGQVGTIHCVTATVQDQNGDPVAGVRVDFTVSGAHTLAGFENTDASGQASFCYLGTSAGNDSIVAAISNLSDDATFTWVASNQPPIARCADRTVVADGVCAADASADDGSFDPDGNLVGCSQSPPPPYAGIGAHPVTLTCVDGEGATASCTAIVTVVDETPPSLVCPADQTLECVDHGAVATFDVTAGDNCGPASASCVPPSGTTFGLGTTNGICSASDGSGNEASCTFSVTVVDTQPPVVTGGDAASYWPPNHAYRTFDVADCVTSVVDACEGSVSVTGMRITRITSDEAEDDKLGSGAQGDGSTCDDIVITGARTAELRVERGGAGNGRVYTVFFDVTDAQGNVTSASCQVGVPHDQSDPGSFPDDGCRYCEGSGCGSCPGHDPTCGD